MSDVALEQVKQLASGLSPQEKAQLVAWLGATLEREMTTAEQTPAEAGQTWGQQVAAILGTLDTSEWESMDIPDSVEWVKQQRRHQQARRKGSE